MPRDRWWDKCSHCGGSGKCDCGDCGVEDRRNGQRLKGRCTTCNGEGGWWRDRETNRKVDDPSDY